VIAPFTPSRHSGPGDTSILPETRRFCLCHENDYMHCNSNHGKYTQKKVGLIKRNGSRILKQKRSCGLYKRWGLDCWIINCH
jgi:hypothetical protein